MLSTSTSRAQLNSTPQIISELTSQVTNLLLDFRLAVKMCIV